MMNNLGEYCDGCGHLALQCTCPVLHHDPGDETPPPIPSEAPIRPPMPEPTVEKMPAERPRILTRAHSQVRSATITLSVHVCPEDKAHELEEPGPNGFCWCSGCAQYVDPKVTTW
jgi:hypothetical protein